MIDHRIIGKEMDLFHIQEEAAGSIFWHENGWYLYSKIKDYMKHLQKKFSYKEVNTPQMVNKSLWEKSGHWDHYSHNMFCVSENNEDTSYALKPMNCACHIQIFNNKVVSYKELPIRLSEFGTCIRNEPSGSLSGLMRVRSFVQDDAHIFCKEDQIQDEVKSFINMANEAYSYFGFNQVSVKLSTRPSNSAGSDEIWEKSEQALKDACSSSNIEIEIQEGEGAFYGPKLEFMIKDRNDKEWQCGTIQVDFVLPERLDCKFTDNDSVVKRPVILHRAILGSFERFIGILLEHYGYQLPVWMNPRALAVIDISDSGFDEMDIFCMGVSDGYIIDRSKENLRKLIKKYSEMKYRYIIVYGNKEKSSLEYPINVLGGEKVTVKYEHLYDFFNS